MTTAHYHLLRTGSVTYLITAGIQKSCMVRILWESSVDNEHWETWVVQVATRDNHLPHYHLTYLSRREFMISNDSFILSRLTVVVRLWSCLYNLHVICEWVKYVEIWHNGSVNSVNISRVSKDLIVEQSKKGTQLRQLVSVCTLPNWLKSSLVVIAKLLCQT